MILRSCAQVYSSTLKRPIGDPYLLLIGCHENIGQVPISPSLRHSRNNIGPSCCAKPTLSLYPSGPWVTHGATTPTTESKAYIHVCISEPKTGVGGTPVTYGRAPLVTSIHTHYKQTRRSGPVKLRLQVSSAARLCMTGYMYVQLTYML
jgi:hypothetical protein